MRAGATNKGSFASVHAPLSQHLLKPLVLGSVLSGVTSATRSRKSGVLTTRPLSHPMSCSWKYAGMITLLLLLV